MLEAGAEAGEDRVGLLVVVLEAGVLLDDGADLVLGEAVGEDPRFAFDLAEQVAVLVDDLADLALETRPNLLLVLNDELRAVQLVLQLPDFHLELAPRLRVLLLLVLHYLPHQQLLRLRLVPFSRHALQQTRRVRVFLLSGLEVGIFIFQKQLLVQRKGLLQVRDLRLQLLVLGLQVAQL